MCPDHLRRAPTYDPTGTSPLTDDVPPAPLPRWMPWLSLLIAAVWIAVVAVLVAGYDGTVALGSVR